MLRLAGRLVVALVALFTAVAGRAATVQAIEYYNASLDHYFVTALAVEIGKLDAGAFPGWQRTGQQFTVFDPATPVAGASPVCRFYGVPAAGLDSHFYSASAAECSAVMQKFAGAWIEETDNAFGVFMPDTVTGACPAGATPVYRAWNGRADSNHRFTTDPATFKAMLAKGYIAEGYGPAAMPVAMCAPGNGSGPVAVPSCVVTASDATPTVGGNVTLTASCTNGPVAFTWTNCISASAQCTATSSMVGAVAYSVVARNDGGSSAPASVQVAWRAPSGSAPRCTIVYTSQGTPPVVNGSVALQANCSGVIGTYAWNGCSSSTRTCVVRETAPGNHSYSVIGRSSSGSSPPATLTLNWASSPGAAPGFCGSFPSYLASDIGSQTVRVESILMPAPAFAWNGVWTVRFVVPATMSAASVGRMSSAEFSGPPTVREATISKTPCDFRATDPSGATGPFARHSGSSNTIQFTTSARPGYPTLTAGGVYYYNVRNFQPSSGTITCAPSPGRCDALVESVLPTR